MISKNEFVNYLNKNKPSGIYYEEETDSVVLSNGKKVPADDFYENYKRKNGESFKTIYSSEGFCMSILICTECGTVIRYFFDENWEPNFRCPICTDYKTGYEYWTSEEIEMDPNLKQMILEYARMAIREAEYDRRIESRGGLLDSELYKKELIFKNKKYVLIFNIDDIQNKNKLKGLYFEVEEFIKKDNENYWCYNKRTIFPLSIESLYYFLIYVPYIKKHPEKDPCETIKGKPLYKHMEDRIRSTITAENEEAGKDLSRKLIKPKKR